MKWITPVATLFLLSTCSNPAPACEYETSDEFIFQGSIESVRIEKKNVFPYVDDTRKCRITIQAKIDGQWYPSTDDFVFGPDVSEMDACDKAENRAKIKVMRAIIPETLKSKRKLKCSKKDLTMPKKSCKVMFMNVSMNGLGQQKVKVDLCDD